MNTLDLWPVYPPLSFDEEIFLRHEQLCKIFENDYSRNKKYEISLSQYLFLYHDVPKHLYLKKVSEGRSVGSLDSRVQSMPLYYNVMTQQKD